MSMQIGIFINESTMDVPQTKIKKELTNDKAFPLLDIYPKEIKSLSQRYTCTSIFR